MTSNAIAVFMQSFIDLFSICFFFCTNIFEREKHSKYVSFRVFSVRAEVEQWEPRPRLATAILLPQWPNFYQSKQLCDGLKSVRGRSHVVRTAQLESQRRGACTAAAVKSSSCGACFGGFVPGFCYSSKFTIFKCCLIWACILPKIVV